MSDQEITRRIHVSVNNAEKNDYFITDISDASFRRNHGRVAASESNRIRLLGMVVFFTIVIVFFTSDVDFTTWVPMKHTKKGIKRKEYPIQMLQDVPTVAEIESTLQREEHRRIHGDNIEDVARVRLHSLAHTYALTYKLIHELQKQQIHVTLTFGSHLGALRHHGVIPFEEKDVDLAVFSTNTSKIKRAIRATLRTQPHLNLTFSEAYFGFQIPATKELQTYIDVWMFKNDASQTTCVGHQLPDKSCKKWYRDFHDKPPPIYRHDAWFPFRTELFGTERVPIPATNIPIESFHFDDGGPNFWNKTCGPDRRWWENGQNWLQVDMRERKCSHKYNAYPFVFKKENGIEQLRQGSVVIHEVDGVSLNT